MRLECEREGVVSIGKIGFRHSSFFLLALLLFSRLAGVAACSFYI